MRTYERLEKLPRERLAELVAAASYGTVLVLATLSLVGVSEVALGHGAELAAGVGVATWLAHLFAEILGQHVEHEMPWGRRVVARATIDGSPILAATVLPAIVLGLGRLDVLSSATARIAAIVVAVLQLLVIGAVVARVAPTPPVARWAFTAATVIAGLVIVALNVVLGH